jgi:hypothetical protein
MRNFALGQQFCLAQRQDEKFFDCPRQLKVTAAAPTPSVAGSKPVRARARVVGCYSSHPMNASEGIQLPLHFQKVR